MIGYGENVGSGFPTIISAWKDANWGEPELKNKFEIDEVELVLPIPVGGANDRVNISTPCYSSNVTWVLPLTLPFMPPPKTLPYTWVLPRNRTSVLPETALSSPPPYTLPVPSFSVCDGATPTRVPTTVLPSRVMLAVPTVPKVPKSSLV